LQTAIQETLQNRGTAYEKDSFNRIISLSKDEDMQIKWRYFLKTLNNPEIPFELVIEEIKTFLSPVWDAIVTEKEILKQWDAKNGLWR
jgi:hypothetical protein